ncbi:MAG TPA: AraC family transcriptional regulator [Vicinamibacterales bacterium]|nr:AraC family transcriptional regulator [Vicinamibacterales bacterium]
MTIDGLPEGGLSVMALARVCQMAIRELTGATWPDFDAIVSAFDRLPAPASYAEATMAAGIAVVFTNQVFDRVHRRIHGSAAPNCSFEPPPLSTALITPETPTAWNPGDAMRQWVLACARLLRQTHRQDLVGHARRRLDDPRAAPAISALARELGCGRRTLEDRFFKETGMTIWEYRDCARVAMAIELRASSTDKIETIARAVGWKSKKGLYGAFRRFGVTPRAARRISRDEAAAIATKVRSTVPAQRRTSRRPTTMRLGSSRAAH